MTSDFDVIVSLIQDLINIRTAELTGLRSQILEDMLQLMTKKGADYSGTDHTWTSFEVAAQGGHLTVDQVFLALIWTKMSRLSSLLSPSRSSEEVTNFESVEDTWMDLANYIVLFVSYKRWSK